MITPRRILLPMGILLMFLFGTAIIYHYCSLYDSRPPALIALEQKEYHRAATFLLEEARKGSAYSQWAYAELQQMRLVPGAKPEQASGWYQKAADAGFRPALVSLGKEKPGVGDFMELEEASARLLHIRAAGGDQEACTVLDDWYLGREEFEQSRFWLIQSVSQGISNNTMRNYYASDALFYHGGTEQDQRRAIEIMRNLANRGFGYYELAKMLETAQGRLRNDWEAEKWYRMSAESGNPEAQLRLGIMYYEGGLIGLRSEYEALRWFKKSVEPRKNDRGYSFIPPNSRLVLLYYLSKGLGGLQESMENTGLSEAELDLLMQHNYDLQKAFYGTAVAIYGSKFEYALKEAKTAAKYGQQNCIKDADCQAMTAWFQVLSGQSKQVLLNTDSLKGINSAKGLFHLGHAYLLQNQKEEALDLYYRGLAKATLHERFLLDDELDLLSWQFSRKHLLFAATRLLINEETKLFSEESILKYEDIKALKGQMVQDKIMEELLP